MIRDLNQVLRLRGKVVRTVENIIFLEKCLESFVTPSHIRHRVSRTRLKRPDRFERAFLLDEIDQRKDFVSRTRQDYRRLLPGTLRELTFFDRLRYCKLLTGTTMRLKKETVAKYEKTLQRLRRSQIGEGELDHSTIINIAGIDLTEIQKDILCRGVGFGVPPHSGSLPVLVEAEFELCWKQLEGMTTDMERKRDCKAGLADLSRRYARERVDKTGCTLTRQHFDVIQELRKNRDIVITRPDKGNGVVLLKHSEYVEKMEVLLSQQDKFERLGSVEDFDHTLQQERALQAFLLRARKNEHISEAVYRMIRPVGSTRPRMYGVPKVHKQGTPLRPILSMTNAPQHGMAKWLTKVLQPVVQKYSGHTVKDSFEFCDNIEEFRHGGDPSQFIMASFDVVSLFTNIPLNETINICLDCLYRCDGIQRPSLPESLLKKMLLKATTEVEFSFNGQMYRQIDGVAMGSPLGPVLANIFVGHCESKIDDSRWPLLYNRFVDDTFSIFNSWVECNDFFSILNGLHASLQFTMESESDGCLPFMDVLVTRRSEGLVRSLYRKPTFTGLYLRWDSFSPTNQKINLIRSLTSRAIKICSACTLEQEISELKGLFGKNGYPSRVVNRTIQTMMDRHRTATQTAITPHPARPPEYIILRLPWLGPVSERYRKLTCDLITNSFSQVYPRVVFTSRSAFSGRAKDVIPTSQKSHIVYQYTCSCALTYVGKTTQCLSFRMKQHIPEKLFAQSPDLKCLRTDSGITRHLKEHPECIEKTLIPGAFKMLAQARGQDHLDVLEALFIQRLTPPLCNQKEHVKHLALS